MEKQSIAQTKTYTYVICALFAALTAVGAFIKIPTPVVNLTLQYLFVALAGILLGAKRGLVSQLLYIGIGLAGIPIFTQGGGIGYVLQPTFGYLIGFALATFLIGKIVERMGSSFIVLFAASVIGLLAAYVIGVIYMYLILNLYLAKPMTITKAIYVGAVTCFPGDLIKCFLAALVGSRLVPVLKKQQLI